MITFSIGIAYIIFRAKEAHMRLDKYLKVSRVIKRRTVANEACDLGRVQINGKVKEGDVLTVLLGGKQLRLQVLSVQEHALKADAAGMYKILEGEG